MLQILETPYLDLEGALRFILHCSCWSRRQRATTNVRAFSEARTDLGYVLWSLHWLMRNDTPGSNLHGRIVTPKEDIAAAVNLVLAAADAVEPTH